MIRFEKGLGDHYRMAVPRVGTMTQTVQDTLSEGSWVQLTLDSVTGKLAFDLLPSAKADAGDADLAPGIAAAPLISNPATPEHSGPFVPMGVAVGEADVIYTDQFNAGSAPAAGARLCASRLTVSGVTVHGLRAFDPTANSVGDAEAKAAKCVVGTCLGVNLDNELVVFWNGR